MTVNPIPPSQTPTAPVEGIAAPAAAAPAEPAQISPQFAALAKQQKALRKAQMEFEAKEAALKARESEYEKNYIPRSKLKENPYAVLTEEGIAYESIMNEALNQDPTSLELQKVRREIESIKADSKKASEDAKNAQQKAYDEAVEHIRNEATELVSSDANYEMIKANNAEEAVVQLIKETFDSTKKLLTVAEAAQKVEDYLLEHALKIAALSKVKQKLSPQEPVTTEETLAAAVTRPKPQQNVTVSPSAQRQQPQQQMKTITNAATMVASKPLTAKQRRERAIAAFQGQQIA